MLQTLGIVHVEFGENSDLNSATALLAQRKLGGRPVLDWMVRRVAEAQLVDGVIVVIDRHESQSALAALAPLDVPVYCGRQDDSLAVLAAALREFPAKSLVRVGVRHPFVDPVLIDRLVATSAVDGRCDYVSYRAVNGESGVLSSVGVFAEWCRTKSLAKADKELADSNLRGEITRLIQSHGELFQSRLIPSPERLTKDDVRLAISSEQDWDHAQEIFEALGPEGLDWQGIAGLIDHQPALRQRMVTMNASEQLM